VTCFTTCDYSSAHDELALVDHGPVSVVITLYDASYKKVPFVAYIDTAQHLRVKFPKIHQKGHK